jgi:hypothetical protein
LTSVPVVHPGSKLNYQDAVGDSRRLDIRVWQLV